MITPPVVGGGGVGGGFSIADLFTGGDMNANAFNNIQALAKLGSSGLGDSTGM